MKDLSTYFECDGAATPGTVMGMGNPMAPEGDSVGSGDTFPTRKTAKTRRKKVKPEQLDDKGQSNANELIGANESILDSDFGLDDSDFGLGFDNLLERLADIINYKENPSETDYEQFYNHFKACAKELAAKSGIRDSIMKACRSKNYTIITFYPSRQPNLTNVIEIRKFIENPRPDAIAVSWRFNHIYYNRYKVNHPTTLIMRNSEWFVVPGNVWDKLMGLLE